MRYNSCKFTPLFWVSLCLIFFRCSKEINEISNIPKGIYVGGYLSPNAVYWNDSKETTLYNGGSVHSMYIKDSIIYCVGSVGHGLDNRAVYWENDSIYFLTEYHPAPRNSAAKSIFINGDDLFIAGYESYYNWGGDIVSRAMIWKNGMPIDLSEKNWWIPSTLQTTANSIVVSESNVYVCGSAGNYARLWKDTQWINLTDGVFQATANAIAVEGGNIYVAGWESNGSKKVAKLWVNGISTNQTDGKEDASFNSIFIKDQIVYLAGYEFEDSNQIAKYWMNDKAYSLSRSDHYSSASGIVVDGNDIWVTGSELVNSYVVARLWKNGNPIDFFPTDSTNSVANCIFMVK